MLYPSMSLFAIMEHPTLSQSSSSFAIKCSWQIVNMFSDFAELVVVDPSISLFPFIEHPNLSQSSPTFAIKCSWQIVYVLINFAEVVVVDPCML